MRAWLSQVNVKLEERDFFKERFSEQEIRDLIDDRPVSEFFSWVSPSFKKLGVGRSALDDNQLIAMMLEQPRLIRRPLIVVNGVLLSPLRGAHRIVPAIESKIQSLNQDAGPLTSDA